MKFLLSIIIGVGLMILAHVITINHPNWRSPALFFAGWLSCTIHDLLITKTPN